MADNSPVLLPNLEGYSESNWVDAVCDQYEQELQEGNPSWQEYLQACPEKRRKRLLPELLAVDWEHRGPRTENPPTPEWECGLLPEQSGLILDAWDRYLQFSLNSTEPLGDSFEEDPVVPPSLEDTATFIRENPNETLTINGLANRLGGDTASGERFHEYELLSELGRGGMGVVYKARQEKLDRLVALKMIRSAELAGTEEVQRFQAEAQAAAGLDHPGIVPVFEVGEHNGQHFFSMGFVEGSGLDQRLKDGPLPPAEAAGLVRDLAIAVEYAHQKGIVHRDLKPANVLINTDGSPRITDFGLAKRLQEDQGLTSTGQIMGTPSYMPPEQALGRTDVGPAADIYSLGAILYCLLTGRPPFQASSVMETIKQVIEKDPLPVRQLNPSVPRDLETICAKCLSKEEKKRYPSAGGLSEELERFLGGHATKARPVSRTEKTWRWCKRNPLVAGLIGLCFLTLVAGMAVSLSFALRMREEKGRADKEALHAGINAHLEREAKEDALQGEYNALLSKTELYVATAGEDPGWTWKTLEELSALEEMDVKKKDSHLMRKLATDARLAVDLRATGLLPWSGNSFAKDVVFSQDGKMVFIAENTTTGFGHKQGTNACHVIGYDVETRQEKERYRHSLSVAEAIQLGVKGSPKSGFRALALSPDGRWIAAGTKLGRLMLWDRKNPGNPPVFLEGHSEEIRRLLFSPDSTRLYSSAAGLEADPIKVWEYSEKWILIHRIHVDRWQFTLSADGTKLATTDGEHVNVLETDGFSRLMEGDDAQDVVYNANNNLLIVPHGREIRLVDAGTGETIHSFLDDTLGLSGGQKGNHAKILGNTRYVVTSGNQIEGVRIYNLERSRRVLEVPSPGRHSPAFAVSRDGRFLAVAESKQVRLYQVRLPPIRTSPIHLSSSIRGLAFSGNSKSLAVLRKHNGRNTAPTRGMQVDRIDLRKWEFPDRWIGWHHTSGDPTRPRANDRNCIALDETGATVVTGEPLLGLFLRNSEGKLIFPQQIPAVGHFSIDVPVGKPIPWETKLNVSLGTLVQGKIQQFRGTDRAVIHAFLRLKPPSRNIPVAKVHGQLFYRGNLEDNQLTPGPKIAEPVHPAGKTLLPDLGVLNAAQLVPSAHVKVCLENIQDENSPRPQVVLESIVLVAKQPVNGTARFPNSIPAHGPVILFPDRFFGVVNGDILGCWDRKTGELLWNYNDVLTKIGSGSSGVDGLSVRGDLLAIASRTGNVVVLDSSTGKMRKNLPGPGDQVRNVQLLSERSILVTTQNGEIGTLDWQSGTYKSIRKATSAVYFCNATRDGKLLVHEQNGNSLHLLRKVNGSWEKHLELGPFASPLADVKLSPNGRWLAWALEGKLQRAHVLDLTKLEIDQSGSR